MTRIVVVLAVYNRKKLTERFLHTILNQSFSDYKVIVVDDGSTDGTSEMISEKFSNVHLIKGDGNLWWAASTNLGVDAAINNFDAEFICTMNDDTEVDFFFLEELYKGATKNKDSIVGCFSFNIYNKRELLYDGSIVNWITGKVRTINSKFSSFQNQDLIPLTYYIGRGVLIPSRVFILCGYYDAITFPQSWSDNDLIFRAKRFGFRVYSARNAIQYIYPEESGHLKLKKEKSWNSYLKYLFINQGGGNIIAFSKFILKCYPWYSIPVSLIFGSLRRILGYWKPSL